MTRTPTAAALATLAALSLLSACAGAPLTPHADAATADCTALAAEMTRAADAQRAAEHKRDEAWKTPLPIAAAARFGQGAVEASQSQQRLDDLRARAARHGCREPEVAGSGLSTAAQGQGLRPRASAFN